MAKFSKLVLFQIQHIQAAFPEFLALLIVQGYLERFLHTAIGVISCPSTSAATQQYKEVWKPCSGVFINRYFTMAVIG